MQEERYGTLCRSPFLQEWHTGVRRYFGNGLGLCPPGTRRTLPAPAEDCGEDSGVKTGMKTDMKTAMETLRALCAERGLLPDADALPCPVPPYIEDRKSVV